MRVGWAQRGTTDFQKYVLRSLWVICVSDAHFVGSSGNDNDLDYYMNTPQEPLDGLAHQSVLEKMHQ